jgi:hypothetical protein
MAPQNSLLRLPFQSSWRRGAQLGCAVVIGSSCAAGCVVPPPPEFQDSTSERPNINSELVVPPLGQILIAQSNGPGISFTIPYSGRDAGEVVIVQFWLNWGLEGETYLQQVHESPSAEDVERTYQGTWNVRPSVPSGCQQLTILLSHESNIPHDSPFRPIDPNLVGRLTWWVNVDVPEGAQQNLTNCPTIGP